VDAFALYSIKHIPLPMMNTNKAYFLAAGLVVLSPFAAAADLPEQQVQPGNLAYIGSNGRVAVGYDTKTKLRGEVYWVVSEDSVAAWVGEGWASGSAGGLKLNYHWIPDGGMENATSQSVRKFFAAVDQNNQHDQKVTLGGGLERENLFFGAYVSAALSGQRTISDSTSTGSVTLPGADPDGRQYTQDVLTSTRSRLYERPYDFGLGARLGRYFDESLLRLSGGLDYEWGRDASNQATLSVMLEKFIANSPHSFSVNAETYQKSGALEQHRNDQRLYFMYRYELGGNSYRPERENRLTHASANTATPAGSPANLPAAPSANLHADPAAGQYETQAKTEKRMVKTSAAMYSDAFFEFDKDKLTPEAKTTLDSVVETLRKSGYSGNIHLVGHTCNIGTTRYNQALSERRALSIKKYLVETGVALPDTIVAEGQGENGPRYPNTKELRYKNRRVDLEFVTFTEKLEDVELPSSVTPSGPTPSGLTQAETAKSAGPAKVEWTREYIDTAPAWLTRALHNTTPHKQSVDVYRQQDREVSVANGVKQYVNRAPGAQNDAFSTNSGETAMLDVLANDSDPDQDALTIVSVTPPAHGNAIISNNMVSYTPAPGFTGQDTFSYTIADDKGASSTAQVTVTVQAVNRPPVAVYDRYSVSAYANSLLDVLANDRDPDGDALSIVSFTQPDTGSISQGNNGYLMFSPQGGFGSTSFSYTISDGKGGTATAMVTLIDP
ncbi:MAG: Ig-like domain-containing protein, partial [Gallionella sp.]|nr:Ig-like domain-containing protein [Gallionella sp.]